MTNHRRWTSLFTTALVLALIVALPAAAVPASTPPAEPDLAASYAAIFSPAPAGTAPAAAASVSRADQVGEPTTETGFAIIYCCSATYCCEAMMSSECDGTRFGSIFNCAMHCSLC